jgi:HlyD family secretion protein
MVLVGLSLGLFIKIEDRASGPFQIRPGARAELRAPQAAFLQEVFFDEGDRVSAGSLVARLDAPNLSGRLAQKRAEIVEAKARLRLLEIGPRPEEVDAQRRRVERAQSWLELARLHLIQAQQALDQES